MATLPLTAWPPTSTPAHVAARLLGSRVTVASSALGPARGTVNHGRDRSSLSLLVFALTLGTGSLLGCRFDRRTPPVGIGSNGAGVSGRLLM